MEIVPLGDSALLVRMNDLDPTAPASLSAVLDAVHRIEALALRDVVELVPAYTSIGVFYSGADLETLKQRIEAALAREQPRLSREAAGREIEIAVCYDGEYALDLEDVARHTGLTTAEVVQRHSAAEYVVSCVGFTPGFPYLSGLPPELATPRRGTPRKEVPAGAVAIGGNQTGIYPQASPGGWNIIGRTALRLFNPEEEPPALLRAGDRVRFRAVTRDEFHRATREASR